MRIFALILICLTLTTSTAFAQAETPIGELIGVEGGVFNVNEAEEASAEIGDPIFMDDVVETDTSARALILLKDETELILGSNASLKIDKYVFDPADVESNEGNFVLKGPFLWVSGLIPKDNKNVSLKTDFGSIGIRGTSVWGGMLKEDFAVFVLDGKVFFTTPTGRVSIEKGEGISIGSQATALEVKKWKTPKIDAAISTVSFEDSANLTETYARVVEDKEAEAPEEPPITEETELKAEEEQPKEPEEELQAPEPQTEINEEN